MAAEGSEQWYQKVKKKVKLSSSDTSDNTKPHHSIRKAVSARVSTLQFGNLSDDQIDAYYAQLDRLKFYDQIVSEIRTGDIFLLRGNERFSKIIKVGTMSTWSHAAVAIVDPPREVIEALAYKEHWNSRVFLLESDTETWDKREGGGIQMIGLREYIEDCYREYGPAFLFVWRSLQIPYSSCENRFIEFDGLTDWLLAQSAKTYKGKKRSLTGAALRTNLREDHDQYFCSEFVAAFYQAIGLLKTKENGGKVVTNYVPRDFSSDQRMDGNDIALLNGAYLDLEVRIRMRDVITTNHTIASQEVSAVIDLSKPDVLP